MTSYRLGLLEFQLFFLNGRRSIGRHLNGHVKKIPSPADAQTWVKDCLEMFAKIRDDAKVALQRPQFVEDHRNYAI